MTDAISETRRLVEAEGEAREAKQRLRDANVALLEANQQLARIPLLEFRVEEIWEARQWLASQNDELRAENEALRAENERLEGLGGK